MVTDIVMASITKLCVVGMEVIVAPLQFQEGLCSLFPSRVWIHVLVKILMHRKIDVLIESCQYNSYYRINVL